MDADSYRMQWATLTGRSEREVYVPEALRGAVAGPDPVSHERVDENGVRR